MIRECRVSVGSDAGPSGLWPVVTHGVVFSILCGLCFCSAAAEPDGPRNKGNSNKHLLAGEPLSFRGVATWEVPGHQGLLFIHDGRRNLLVARTNTEAHPKPGDLVEVQGRAAAGQFQATVNDARVKVAGTAPLPEPLAATARQLATQNHFGEWVRLEGMVHDAGIARGDLVLQVTSKTQPFYAYVSIPPGFSNISNLVESTVELTGVVWTLAGTDQRPYGFRLHVPGTNCLRIVRARSPDLFDRALTNARQLRGLSESRDDHVKVKGIVTYVYRAARAYRLVLEDETGPIAAYLHVPIGADPNVAPFWRADPNAVWHPRPQPPQVEPGDLVEVAGSPSAEGEFVPLLHGGEPRVLKRGVGIVPREVAAREALSMALDHALVKLRARVLGGQISGAGRATTFWAQSDGIVFEARLPGEGPTEAEVPKNALVEFTGLARPLPGQPGRAPGLQIELRDRSDIRLVHESSPLLSPTVLRWLGVLTGTLLLALAWVWLLRKQVTRRTAELATSVEERKRAQENLMKALQREREMIELKSSFVSIVSHEFRTPLGVIVSSADILGRYFDRLTLEKRQDQLDLIRRATTNLSELVDDILVLGKMEAGKHQFLPVPLALAELCRKIVDEVLSSTHRVCPIRLKQGGPLDAAVGDEGLIRLILSNLLSNGVKYSPAGEEVEFLVERETVAPAGTRSTGSQILQGKEASHLLASPPQAAGPLLASAQPAVLERMDPPGDRGRAPLRDYVRFRIRDRGIGIPPEDQKRLFETFTRGSNVGERPGTGLGLMIVKRCVELHHGTIELESAPETGTIVTVRLPMFYAGVN